MTTAVLLCDRGLEAGEPAPAATEVLPDLCGHPQQAADAARGADRLVVGMCPGELSLGRLQSAAREAGIDPLGIQLVDLAEAGEAPGRLVTTLAGAVARAEAFTGSEPHHSKLSLPDALSRRQLLRSLMPEYRAAPSINEGFCRAPDGCQACVGSCPRQALRTEGSRIVYDRTRCEPCGRCVTACPVGAVVNPGVVPAAIAAQVRALTGAGPEPIGIAFTCERGSPELAPGWFAVQVPCSSMITVPWLLAPLAMGAGSAALIPCSAAGCPLEQDDAAIATLEFAGAFLAAVGCPEQRVHPVATAPVATPWPVSNLADPFSAGSGTSVLLAVAAYFGDGDAHVPGLAAPAGVVAIDTASCTLCGRCAASCPTGALGFTQANGSVALSFDAADCPACAQCVPRCPELARGAIRLRKAADLAALGAGRQVLLDGATRACESCGRPVATERLLAHLGGILGPDHAAARAGMSRRCSSCRRLPTA